MASPGPATEVRCLLNQYCHSGARGPSRPRGPGSSCRWPGWGAGRAPGLALHRGQRRGGRPRPAPRRRPLEAAGPERQQPRHGRRGGRSAGSLRSTTSSPTTGRAAAARRAGRSWPAAPTLRRPCSAQLCLVCVPVPRGVAGREGADDLDGAEEDGQDADQHDQHGQGAPGWRMHRKPRAIAMMPRMR